MTKPDSVFSSNSLSAWLERLEQLNPDHIDLGLMRVRSVADRMDWPDELPPIATIAGTNGKGTCAFALEALCLAANISTGTYTSPHLIHYSERIRINGHPASDDQICRALNRVEAACENIELTYFEYGTLAAIDLFLQEGIAQIILEVGLGGRLDAVNILDADIAVVTSIGFDHMDWLGDSLEQIGTEKAGIFKNKSTAVIASPDIPGVVRKIAEQVCPKVLCCGTDYQLPERDSGWSWRSSDEDQESRTVCWSGSRFHPASIGAAVTAFYQLGWNLDTASAGRVISELSIPGRQFEVEWRNSAGRERSVILDVAHNPDAAAWLRTALVSQLPGSIGVVIGMMQDKDTEGLVREIAPLVKEWRTADIPDQSRALEARKLATRIRETGEGVVCGTFGTPEQALCDALENGKPDRVLVCGSFYTVGRCLNWLQSKGASPRFA